MDPSILFDLLAFILTILVLLYLVIGDNPIFRMVVYSFIGVTSGYVAALVLFQVIIPRLVSPAFSGEPLLVGFAALQAILGVMLFLKLGKRTAGVGTLPLAILAGVGAATVIGGAVYGTLFQQIGGTVALFDLSLGEDPLTRLIEGVFVLAGSVSVLAYFHYGARARVTDAAEAAVRPVVMEALGKAGRVFIGITLGAVFAGVYTAALTALVERIGFVYSLVTGFTR